jgi:hypothetical protein
MITVISAMQQYQGLLGCLVMLVVLQPALAQMDGWDDPSVSGSNMGLRIMKRGGHLQCVYRISDTNQKRYPEILQILKRNIPTMNLVSKRSKN